MIENETQYQEALKWVYEVWECDTDTPEGQVMDMVVNEIVKYEGIHYPI